MLDRDVNDWCHHFPYGNVPAGHKCDVKYVLVGEAAGKTEAKLGRPFVGEAGRLLFGGHHLFPTGLVPSVGLRREDFYITNVLQFRPPANKFDAVPIVDVELSIRALRSRLLKRVSPNVIVVAGNHALEALTEKHGIMKWRGSILSSPFGKVIPIIHPASVLRTWSLLKTEMADWEKIAREGKSPLVRLPHRMLFAVQPNDRRLQSLLSAPALAVDIECDRETHTIFCVAFAVSRTEAYSIDCRKGLPEIVRKLLACPAVKIFQKGMFDCFVLVRKYDCKITNWLHDTSTMYHALDNNVGPQSEVKDDQGEEGAVGGKALIKPYSLAYMASVFTDEPYWKDDAKDNNTGERYGAWRNRWREFQIYNARDAAVTFELFEALRDRLRAAGRWDWYLEHYSSLLGPLFRLSVHGVRADVPRAQRESDDCKQRQLVLRRDLSAIDSSLTVRHVFKKEPKKTGERSDGIVLLDTDGTYGHRGEWIRLGKSISTSALKALLKECKLKIRRGADETADEVMLRQLQLDVAEKKHTWNAKRLTHEQMTSLLSSVLAYRKLDSKLRFLQAKSVDEDGRVRSEYSMLIQTGRLSASGNALGTGMNLQNQKRDIRHLYLPDRDDWFLLSVDYKQAEDLVVKALSHDKRAYELIEAVQNGTLDIHKRLAAGIFHTLSANISYEQRYVSKRTRHARNFDMQVKRFQLVLLKDGFVVPLAECARILAEVDALEPWVPAWHLALRRLIMRHRVLYTPQGWRLDFKYERPRDSMYFRRGYAFIPQSTVGVAMKQQGLKVMDAWLDAQDMESCINMLVHDELVFSCPRDELFDVAFKCNETLTRPILVKNRTTWPDDKNAYSLSIPVDITIGRHLKCICDECKAEKPGMLTFDKLTSRKEFYAKFERWNREFQSNQSQAHLPRRSYARH